MVIKTDVTNVPVEGKGGQTMATTAVPGGFQLRRGLTLRMKAALSAPGQTTNNGGLPHGNVCGNCLI